MGEPKEWKLYFERPEVRPLWRLRRASEAKGCCSVAAVRKRSGVELRKILMVCPFNWAVEHVDVFMSKVGHDFDYGLRDSGALTQGRLVDGTLSVASADQSNAFTFVVAPESWWCWQSGPKIRCRDLPTEWTRGRFDPSDWIRPQYRRLAMGFTHAVAILLTINREAVLQTARMFRAETSLGLLSDPM